MKFTNAQKIFVGFIFLFSIAVTSAAQENNPYTNHACYLCHGYEGQGGGFGGPRIAPQPLPYEAFAEVLRRPYGVMPAYSPKVLSDEEMKLIYDYLLSIPEPPGVDTVNALLSD